MVNALDSAVGAGVVTARWDFVDVEALIESAGEFGAELWTVVGEKGDGASPEGDVTIDEDIPCAGCGELGLSRGVHVGAAADTVGEKENINFAPRHDG